MCRLAFSWLTLCGITSKISSNVRQRHRRSALKALKRARADAGLTISELAKRAGVSRDTISNAERGQHSLQATTLSKIAQALGRAPSDLLAEEERLAPKAPRRSSLEPSLFNGLEGERYSEAAEAVFGLMERWHERRFAEVGDPNSPHFRDPSAAALWVAASREEAQDLCEWLADFVAIRANNAEAVRDALYLFFGALALDGPAKAGEERLGEMAGKPDDLTARRLERAKAEEKVSMERVQEIGRAVND